MLLRFEGFQIGCAIRELAQPFAPTSRVTVDPGADLIAPFLGRERDAALLVNEAVRFELRRLAVKDDAVKVEDHRHQPGHDVNTRAAAARRARFDLRPADRTLRAVESTGRACRARRRCAPARRAIRTPLPESTRRGFHQSPPYESPRERSGSCDSVWRRRGAPRDRAARGCEGR